MARIDDVLYDIADGWAINDTKILTKVMSEHGFVDTPVTKLKDAFPYRFELPGRLSAATWTMWKMVLTGPGHGSWTFTSSADEDFIAFYFSDERDFIWAKMIAGNDDRPEDGWVPEEMILAAT